MIDFVLPEPAIKEYTIFAVATMALMVPDAIQDGEWYGSPMAAAAVADQMSFEMNDGPYKVYEVTIKEMQND